jgi:hypothetical protein
MSILFAGLLLSVWGLLVYSAPTRKRYRRPRRRAAGYSDIDGEDNATSASDDAAGGHSAESDGGGGDFSGDIGGGDIGGGGDCGGGDGGGGCGGGD